jgi:endonuclease YncB( thermonuclease family)
MMLHATIGYGITWHESVAKMAVWGLRRSARAPAVRRSDGRALIVLLLLVVGLGIYAYRYWPPTPPVVGSVVRVADGDSIEIAGMRMRLEGIDAPELDQTCTDGNGRSWPCGRTARRELRDHIGDRELKCSSGPSDRFRRVLAVCFLPDGSNVNAWMVRQGWAVASGFAGTYRVEEDEAKAAKRGIWAGTFEAPRQWRQRTGVDVRE